jgi:ABC-type multidrug transport system fused ATPase/permease subunit
VSRVQKRFLQKIAKPVLIPATLIGTGIVIHYIATLFGYTLQHVIAYAGILFVYLVVPLLILGVWLWYVVDKIYEKWQEAREEVAYERQQLMETLHNNEQ